METKNTNDALNNAVEKALELAEKTGNFVIDEPSPFLDDYGNPIASEEPVQETKPKTTRRRRTKKAETETVDADA